MHFLAKKFCVLDKIRHFCPVEIKNVQKFTWDQEMTIQRGNTEINVVPYYKWCLRS